MKARPDCERCLLAIRTQEGLDKIIEIVKRCTARLAALEREAESLGAASAAKDG